MKPANPYKLMIKRDCTRSGKSQVASSHFFQFQRPSSRICVLKILERRESIGHCRSIMVSPLCIHSGLVSATFSQAINYLWLRMPKGQEKFRKNFMEPENFRLSPNFFDANDKFEPRFEKKFFSKSPISTNFKSCESFGFISKIRRADILQRTFEKLRVLYIMLVSVESCYEFHNSYFFLCFFVMFKMLAGLGPGRSVI